jgi:hypothetical protein
MKTHALRLWYYAIAALTLLLVALLIFAVFYKFPRRIKGLGIIMLQGRLSEIISPDDGVLRSWLIEEGDSLKEGDIVASMRPHNSDKDLDIKSAHEGIVAEIISYGGSVIKRGQSLALMTPHGDLRNDLELIGFVSSLEGKKIQKNMKVKVWPTISEAHHDGALLAYVKDVGKLPMSKSALQSIIKIPSLATYIRNNIKAEPFLVIIRFEKDSASKSGYRFSKGGPPFELDSGIIADFDVIYDEQSLLELFYVVSHDS